MSDTRCELVRGNITSEQVDAIVNAANGLLLGGGGVDGAIHHGAGPRLLEECRRLRATTHRDGLAVGDAVATGAGNLPCRWVIHTVGPNWNRGQRDEADLVSCFRRSLEVAGEVGATSIAFPAVSGGSFGWAAETVARVAVTTARAHAPAASVGLVRFVVLDGRLGSAFAAALDERRTH